MKFSKDQKFNVLLLVAVLASLVLASMIEAVLVPMDLGLFTALLVPVTLLVNVPLVLMFSAYDRYCQDRRDALPPAKPSRGLGGQNYLDR